MDGGEKQCAISSVSNEIGENQTILPIEVVAAATPLTIVFNPRYVLEGINALAGEKIIFLANDSTTPVALRAYSANKTPLTEAYLYIMMPIRK